MPLSLNIEVMATDIYWWIFPTFVCIILSKSCQLHGKVLQSEHSMAYSKSCTIFTKDFRKKGVGVRSNGLKLKGPNS